MTQPANQKLETQGVSPKVPVQAIVAILAWAITYFGLDASPVVSFLVPIVIGSLGGYVAPPGAVKVVPNR